MSRISWQSAAFVDRKSSNKSSPWLFKDLLGESELDWRRLGFSISANSNALYVSRSVKLNMLGLFLKRGSTRVASFKKLKKSRLYSKYKLQTFDSRICSFLI